MANPTARRTSTSDQRARPAAESSVMHTAAGEMPDPSRAATRRLVTDVSAITGILGTRRLAYSAAAMSFGLLGYYLWSRFHDSRS